jgi:DNA polymerase III alpha subunit
VDEDDEVRLDGDPVRIDYEWQIPPEYLQLDVYARVAAEYEKLMPDLSSRYTPAQFDAALDRISVELSEFERRGMINFLRTIIYILDVFRRDGVVWGVGRGSSCASYVLFILGLHSVDSILYNTPMEEFFHD